MPMTNAERQKRYRDSKRAGVITHLVQNYMPAEWDFYNAEPEQQREWLRWARAQARAADDARASAERRAPPS